MMLYNGASGCTPNSNSFELSGRMADYKSFFRDRPEIHKSLKVRYCVSAIAAPNLSADCQTLI